MMPDRNPILSYDAEQRLRDLLASTAETDGLRAPDRVEAALIGELRRRKRWLLTGRLAAAGALAAAVLIGLLLTRPAPPIPAPPPIAVSKPLEEKYAPAPAPPPAPVVMKVPYRQPRKPIEQQQRIAAIKPNEFIPVGAWQALEPMERGSIVRVRLPKSSLPGLGIPVSADRWNESIPADVVLGEDGTLRAVRFVKASQ